MKSFRITLITASCLLFGFTGLSQAQNAVQTDLPHRARMQKMHDQRADEHAKHLAEIKSKLHLSADQESAWQSFAQSMQGMDHKLHPDRAAFEKMTTPERIDQMQAMKVQRDAVMQKHAEATKTFYAQLNAEQKKVFDVQTMVGMRSMGAGMHHMRHGQPGQR